jgi:hypothetical protein
MAKTSKLDATTASICKVRATDIGVPIKLFHEAEGHVVTVELRTGDTYRGLLEEAEDTMNCKLSEGK